MPLVHTMHTMARVKNAALAPASSTEPDVPRARRGRDRRRRRRADRQHRRRGRRAAAALRRHAPIRSRIVPPGVDLHTFHPCDQPKSRAQLGVPQDAQVILFVGRIQPLKAPDVLIRAVGRAGPPRPESPRPAAADHHRQPQRTGRRSGRRPCAAGAGPGGADLVEFRPHSPRAELFRWYCVSDVVGVPSYNESFGLVALEAQACGRPVVATDVGGLRHAVRDEATGILVRGHDPRTPGPTPWPPCWTTRSSALDGRRTPRPTPRVQLGQHRSRHPRAYALALTGALKQRAMAPPVHDRAQPRRCRTARSRVRGAGRTVPAPRGHCHRRRPTGPGGRADPNAGRPTHGPQCGAAATSAIRIDAPASADPVRSDVSAGPQKTRSTTSRARRVTRR